MIKILRNKNPKWEYKNPMSKEYQTQKWMEDVGSYLNRHCDYLHVSNQPKNMRKEHSIKTQEDMLVLDLRNTYLVHDMVVNTYKRWDVDLKDVPFIELKLNPEKTKSLTNYWTEYLIERLKYDLDTLFPMSDYHIHKIPFFYIGGGKCIRIFDTNLLDSNGKKIDVVKEVK